MDRVVSRKYLHITKLSFSACLAENPGWLTTGGILRAKRA
jgi:hypothetical protein